MDNLLTLNVSEKIESIEISALWSRHDFCYICLLDGSWIRVWILVKQKVEDEKRKEKKIRMEKYISKIWTLIKSCCGLIYRTNIAMGNRGLEFVKNFYRIGRERMKNIEPLNILSLQDSANMRNERRNMNKDIAPQTKLVQIIESRYSPANGLAGVILLSLVNDTVIACCCNCNCNCCSLAI